MLIPVDEVFEDLATQRLCYLDVECEGVAELRAPLAEKDVVIGRSRSCDVTLPIPSVSTRHARVGCRGEEFYVEDLGSTNGTYVNGVRVRRCTLYSNDVLRVGNAKLHFIQHKIRRET